MNNQTKSYSEQITEQTKAFTLFGEPTTIYMDGEDITQEVKNTFGIATWLRRLVRAFGDFRVTAFTLSRVNGVVKLYIKSVY